MLSQSVSVEALRRHIAVPAFVAALLGPFAAHHAAHALFVETGTYVLQRDETHEVVTINYGAALKTNGHKLTVTGSGGLTCLAMPSLDGGEVLITGDNGRVVLNGGGTHSIGHSGAIKLCSSSAVLEITGSSATISGRGEIIGEHPDAKITIANGKTLTSHLVITGTMTICGSGKLKNEEAVIATDDYEAGDTIVLGPYLNLADIDGAAWVAEGGVLQFNHAQTGNTKLLGDVGLARQGTLDFNVSITINDGLSCPQGGSVFEWISGTLDVASGATFTYQCFSSGSGIRCLDPGTGTPASVPGPYEVTCPIFGR